MRVSENGAPIQTGRGLEETKRRITEAFERSRHHLHAPASPSLPSPQESQGEAVYAEHHEAHFHARAKLTLVALSSSHIMKTEARGNGSEIAVPLESAEELIAEALRRFK